MKTNWMAIGFAAVLIAGCGDGTGNEAGDHSGRDMGDPAPAGDLRTSLDWIDDTDLFSKKLPIEWQLMTALLEGGNDNGFQVACDDKNYKQYMTTGLVFTVKSAKGGTSTTTLACPGPERTGTGIIDLPDTTGPFTITAVALGQPASKSETVCGVLRTDSVTVRIYLAGCDASSCIKDC